MKIQKKIIHIDMDYFFAQVEELKNPSLKGRPVGIGSADGRGVLCTSNYEARKYGVKSAMSAKIALRKCPQLILIPPRFKDYKLASAAIFEIFKDYTDKIEGLSLDEAYLDVTECELFNNSAYLIAKDIRARVFEETGLTCSAGISYNKFLAKFACEHNKPNGQFLIPPSVSSEFLGEIDVQKISGVGKVVQETLNQKNIFKLKDLWPYEKHELQDKFGRFGSNLFYYCRGIDEREVDSTRVRKSLSVENTFYQDLCDLKEIEVKFESLYAEFLKRLEKYSHKELASIFVKIKYHDFDTRTIERRFVSLDKKYFDDLLKERFQERTDAIRLLGVGVKFKDPNSTKQLLLPLIPALA